MTPQNVFGAVERHESDAVPQLHGAATPVPLPSEPEPPPTAIPLPDKKRTTDVPDSPEEPAPHFPQAPKGRWERMFFLAGESPDEFSEFHERLDNYYMPFNDEERVCVIKLAEARWALARRKRVVELVEGALYAANADPTKWSEADFKRLAAADEARLRAERIVRIAQQNVEGFNKIRDADAKWHNYYALAERRFEWEKRRDELGLTQPGTRTKEAAA